MRVDMTPLITGKTDTVSFEYEYDGAAEMFPEFSFGKPVHVRGKVVDRSGYMFLTLHADMDYDTVCDRCLAELHRSLSLDYEKNVALSGTLSKEEEDDYAIITDSALDVDTLVEELLFLETPSRHLCKEDCLGLCQKCGKNKNEGGCSCGTKEIDPRLEILKKFLDD